MISDWNVAIFRMINDLGKDFTALNPIFVFIAEYMVYFLLFGIVAFWFTRSENNRMMIISGVITFAIAEVLAKIAGMIHQNNQPFAELPNVNQLIEHAIDNSFPSDHTMLFFAFCMTFWLFGKRFGYLWIILAITVAISRIWVGVHYPGDVTVGALIGIITAIAVHKIVPNLSFIKQLLAIYEKGEQYILPAKKEKNIQQTDRDQ